MSAERLIAALLRRDLKLAVAESLTGGLLAGAITEVSGASKVFLGSITAYQSVLKQQLLGVSGQLLENQGAVDPEVVAQMATGVRRKLSKSCGLDETKVIGIATTGVAGPDEQDGKPVGAVFIGISGVEGAGEVVYAHSFEGTRSEIRQQTVTAAIAHLLEHFDNLGG
jgi:nicotinamide-nucleotide amidase